MEEKYLSQEDLAQEGVSVAANFAVASLGSETSGSILSPSSKNS